MQAMKNEVHESMHQNIIY